MSELDDGDGGIYATSSACRDMTDIFFSNDQHDVRLALAVCKTCPILEECRERALSSEPRYGYHGTEGGMTWQQRKDIRRTQGHRLAG